MSSMIIDGSLEDMYNVLTMDVLTIPELEQRCAACGGG